ncbi:hypothetical protein D9M68_847210 [compost metagenome]
MADQLLGFGGFGALGGRLLGWADFAEVAFQCHFQSHALGAAALDVYTPNHFVFGAACPVFGIALGAEGFGIGRPTGFAHEGLPSAGFRFDDGSHLSLLQRRAAVPALY